MGIEDEDIVRVRQASDIVAVVSEHVALRRVGRRWQGLCPFHSEKSASFSVNQEEGLYYCFGCGAKGDVITFVREIEHADFVGAVEKLAGRAGIALRYTDQAETEGRKKRGRLLEAVDRAVDWYHERLLTAPDAAAARGYLRSRGLDGDDVRAYRIGWAPEGWDTLARALRLPDDVFVEAGLGYLNNRGRPTDAFRARVLFPIFDVRGDAVGFGGRVLPGGQGPKYKNSAESSIYAKSRLLYGLNWVKSEVVAADEVIVCEGYTDVIGFAKAGVPRAVATCGTALTEDHVKLLRGFARRVVLAFDADAAGQNAAEKFYAWERTYDLDVAVADLPAGVDPADLAASDPDALRGSVERAVPFLKFRVERVLGSIDRSTAEGRARAAEAAMAVIREHPSELVRDQYVMDVASRTQIDPDRLRQVRARPPAADAPRGRVLPASARLAGGASGRARATITDSPEVEALRLLVHRRDEVADWLDPVLFDDPVAAEAYAALAGATGVLEASSQCGPEAADLLQRISVEDTEAVPDEVVGRLAEAAARRSLAVIEADARSSDDPEGFAWSARTSAWVKLRVEELREPATALDATEQLLAWLTRRPEEDA